MKSIVNSVAAVLLFTGAAHAAMIAGTSFEGETGDLAFAVSEETGGNGATGDAAMADIDADSPLTGGRSYHWSNTDGPVRLTFDAVDIAAFIDVEVAFHFATDGSFEADDDRDQLLVQVIHNGSGASPLPIVDFGGAPLGADGAVPDNANYAANGIQSIAIPDDATELTLIVQATTSTDSEHIYVDDVSITGTSVPEPASLVLLALAGLMIVRRRRG